MSATSNMPRPARLFGLVPVWCMLALVLAALASGLLLAMVMR
jgi:hypothetical protein